MTTDLDLTEAVDAAARALYDGEAQQYRHQPGGESPPPPPYDEAPAIAKHRLRETVLPLITAAAPIIAAQIRAETLREAADVLDREAERHTVAWYSAAERLRRLAASPAPTGEARRG